MVSEPFNSTRRKTSMAFHLASSSALCAAPSYGFSVTEKLERNNYRIWRLQVTSTLKGAQMMSFLDSTNKPPAPLLPKKNKDDEDEEQKPNPDYESWVAKEQMVLSFILTSLGKEISGQMPITVVTPAKAWKVIKGMFASQSRARVMSTRMALSTATKGASTISEYFVKMKRLDDEMAAAGRKLEDEELVSYILTGLDQDYDSVVSAVAARVEPISVGELFTQLTSFESRMEMKNGGPYQSSANLAAKGGRGNNNNNTGFRGGGRGNGRNMSGRGRGGRNGARPGGGFQAGVFCHLCGKEGHTVIKCFKRFDTSFSGLAHKSASSAITSYGVDSNWYLDSGFRCHRPHHLGT